MSVVAKMQPDIMSKRMIITRKVKVPANGKDKLLKFLVFKAK